MRKPLASALTVLLLSVFHPAWSQPSPLIVDQGRADRAPARPTTEEPDIAPPPADVGVTKIEPFVLKSVRIRGSSLAPDVLGIAAKPFIGKTVAAKDLQEIANAVSRAYADRGDVAFYTVVVPKQDFADGALDLSVAEGYIEHVDLGGDTGGRLELVIGFAAQLMSERPLRRSTFQRYISLIRDIPGITADAKLMRGSAVGAVRLLLVIKQRDWRVALSADDMGSNPLGRVQTQTKASLYGLLREGEETSLVVGLPIEAGRFQYLALSEAQPLDNNGTQAQAAFGYLRTRPRHPSPSGDAGTLQFLVSHPLLRSYDESLYVSGSVDAIDSTNATLGEIVANERIRALRLATAYIVDAANSAFSLGASMNFGLNIFGARTTDPRTAETGFKKFVLRASYDRLLDTEWIARLRAATQLALCRLPVSELYAVGGENFGRAFPSASAFGDSALAGSAELAYRPQGLPGIVNGSEVFGFAEEGGTWYRARSGSPPRDFRLASAGFGVRIRLRTETQLEISAANGIAAVSPGVSPGKWHIGFRLTTAR